MRAWVGVEHYYLIYRRYKVTQSSNLYIFLYKSCLFSVVMLTGEFDASDIKFNKNVYSYAIFLIFVFMISTVLFNLLNGLAVSDTQAIKSEAELMNFIYRAELMSRYEKILLGKGESDW